MIDETTALTQTLRLAGLPGWPFVDEAVLELRRIVQENALDEDHAKRIIGAVVEDFERCPTPRELKKQFKPLSTTPAKACPLGKCDGTGWLIVERNGKSGVKPCGCRNEPLRA